MRAFFHFPQKLYDKHNNIKQTLYQETVEVESMFRFSFVTLIHVVVVLMEMMEIVFVAAFSWRNGCMPRRMGNITEFRAEEFNTEVMIFLRDILIILLLKLLPFDH